MKPLTATEAQLQIVDMIQAFNDLAQKSNRPAKMNGTIEGVAFLEFFSLYSRIKTARKRLFLPGEYGTETMVMVYCPAPGYTICIESEPCIKVCKGSIKRKNMN